jgi:hypothetical protein
MRLFIAERLSYDKLFRISDPKRVTRSLTVRGPPLEIDSYQDAVYYAFNFKSHPSTTGLRWRGYVKFIKPKTGRDTPLQHVDCVVDCSCPDYRYRWAWANKQRGSSQVGPQSLNQAWNRAPRKTNPKGKPGLCKHILAARQYIYGLLAAFPSDKPDTADKLNKLTKFAQKRWTDFPGQMRAAKERDAETRRRQALRNVVGPVLPIQAVPADRPTSVAGRTQVPEPEKSTAAFTALQPPPLPKPISGKPAKPAKPTVPPKPAAKIKPAPRTKPWPHGAYALPDDANNQDFKNYLMECVVNANGDSMSTTLNEAIKLVEEMEADELTAAPAAAALDDPVDSAMEPSEPPVSDSAVGADTEEDTALGLLRQMRDFLAQLATALAPEETPEAPEGEEVPGGEGAMPPEPPADEKEEDEDEEEELPDRRPVEK